MAATLPELRVALASVLEDQLPDFNIYSVPPDDVVAPAVMVGGFQIDPATFGDTTGRVVTEIQIMVSRRHVDQVTMLDELLSPTSEDSLWQLFDREATLGDVVGMCSVTQAGGYEQIVIADVGYYSASATLTVIL